MDKLTEIMVAKRREIESRIRPIRERELSRLGEIERAGLGFAESLRKGPGLSVIAEIKRKSPSAGKIAELPDPTDQARKYYNAQVNAISVLTDEPYFGGTIKDLWSVHDLLGSRADSPPLLRKDFFVHPIQIVEAAEAGARAILIIVRALNEDEMKCLFESASIAGLESLFEIHDEWELETALKLGAQIIGVNNRDLKRFCTDLERSERIIPQIPSELVRISESGIWTLEDAARVYRAGANAALIGEALMKSKDVDAFVADLHSL
jgi:indole-3-glycerol phosphate synthase